MWSAEARRGILYVACLGVEADHTVAFESHWNTWIGLAAQAGDLGLCLHSFHKVDPAEDCSDGRVDTSAQTAAGAASALGEESSVQDSLVCALRKSRPC